MKRTRPLISFIDLQLPTSWEEVSATDVAVWARLVSQFGGERAKVYFVLHHIAPEGLRFLSSGEVSNDGVGEELARLDPLDVAVAVLGLDFLDVPPAFALPLERIGRWELLSHNLQGVPFERYLVAENFYQGFLSSQKVEAIGELLNVLSKERLGDVLGVEEQFLALLWYASVKLELSAMFPDLFRPYQGDEAPEANDLRQMVDAQIRALTGGDITKEEAILSADTWRALTELNAKAREANEYNTHHV